MLLSAENFMNLLISFSSRTWSEHLRSVPNLPVTGLLTLVLLSLIDQKPTEDLWVVIKRKMRHQSQQYRWAEGRYQRNLDFQNTSAVPQDEVYMLHQCSNSYQRSAKYSPSTKWTILFRVSACVNYKTFLVFCNILIFWDTGYLTFISCA